MRFWLRQLGLNRPFKSRSSWKHANVTQNLQYIKMKKKITLFCIIHQRIFYHFEKPFLTAVRVLMFHIKENCRPPDRGSYWMLTVTGGDNYGNNSLMSEVNDVMSKPISCVLTPLSIMPRCSPSFFLSRLVLCVYHNIQVCCGKLITCHIDSYHIQLKSMIIPLLYFNLLLQIMLHLFFFIFEVECRRTR